MFDKDASSVALTTDVWTSTSVEAYMAMLAHYITRDWKAVCCILETKYFPGSHTGIAISDRLLETVKEFNIENKVSAIVHDQASNVQLSA